MANERRRRYLIIVTGLLFLLIAGKLFYLQIISGKRYFRLAEANRIRKIYLPAPRGRIIARNDVILADSRPTFAVSVVPSEIDSQTIKNLASFAPIDEARTRELITDLMYLHTPIKVKRNIDLNTVIKLEENSKSLKGVSIETEPTRIYSTAESSAHIIGYLNEVTFEEVKSDTYYRPWHYIGRAGIEAQYEKFLRGKEGIRYTEIDAAGRDLGPLPEKREVLPQSGNDVYITIDAEIQNLAYNLLCNYKRGTIVGIDLHDGSIICLVSYPSFDPGKITKGISSSEWQKLLYDKSSPMMNRAITSCYPPGSTIKPLIALAALESKLIQAETHFQPCEGSFTYGNRSYKCWTKHGRLDLIDAIVHSCNVYFYQLGLKIGLDKITSYLMRWGIDEKTGIDLSGERKGNIPTRAWLDKHYGKNRWTRGIIPNLAIGQGEILVTPLQLAVIYSAIAGNGEFYTPHLLQKIKSGDKIVKEYKPVKKTIKISPENIKIIRDALFGVVDHGTGGGSKLYNIPIAGKTGTAENPHGLDHAWFVGYGPADNPQVLFCAIIENVGKGGAIAAPIVRQLFEKYFELYPVTKYVQTN